ncbi:calcium-binding EF hand family protein [Striga asiatica]|uniref:Calcium-binding EF hand family protein n=1 Tax=Striga asiatica TaxID=4170 RepID=A0A5A7QAX5_STRAF|nr:calcium-binding EF hand family protein [Striga asiatica]
MVRCCVSSRLFFAIGDNKTIINFFATEKKIAGMAGAGGVNMEKFEEYFQRADMDRDGKISGVEAVAFLQGSNLSRQVLAQIWAHADQNHTGFLSRSEFYNALRLVTVAQSKRELTSDIVKAALYGPASAKIPPPQINMATTLVPQPNPVAASPLPQMGATIQSSPQNSGFRGLAPPTPSANPQFGALQPNTGMTQQLRPMHYSAGTNQLRGPPPSSSGVNQQYPQLQPTVTINQHSPQFQPASTMNQQFGQVQPTSTSMNRPFGQSQPLNTGTNQQLGQVSPSANINQNFFPTQGNQIRPPLSMSITASHPPQAASSPNVSGVMAGPGLSNSNRDSLGGSSGPASSGPTTQNNLIRGLSPSISTVAPSPVDLFSTVSATTAKDLKGSVASGNVSTPDLFSGNQSSSWKVSSAPQQPGINPPSSTAVVPVTSSSQLPAKPDPFEALRSTLIKPSTATQTAQTQSLPKSNQQASTQVTSSVLSPGVQAGLGNSTTEQPQAPWPKMTRAGIQKYAKVFMEVDTDRDGKITGDQARNLFLSWRLPREVLKQVWDLSDQDSDSMLSLREFCVALYLMEQYREGRQLPSALPNSVMLDETLLSLAGPPTAYGSAGWGSATGIRPQQGFHGSQPVTPAGLRPPMQPITSQYDGSIQLNQKSAGGPTVDNSHANQLSNGDAKSLDAQELGDAETNELVLPAIKSLLFCFTVDNKEKLILDSREKLEFYRTKMQDLVLYKSRCDNRLNEITERARADKNEAELLEKKYQEKYKQVAEIHSKLTIEEAAFREIQLTVFYQKTSTSLRNHRKHVFVLHPNHCLPLDTSEPAFIRRLIFEFLLDPSTFKPPFVTFPDEMLYYSEPNSHLLPTYLFLSNIYAPKATVPLPYSSEISVPLEFTKWLIITLSVIESRAANNNSARKSELQQAIIKMEQGGSADGILQVRADRIQSDLEELMKALADRGKKHSVEIKSSALIELPQGWQPGVPEVAAIWDEDWDKFEDEGFSFDVTVPENAKSPLKQGENSSPTHSFSPGSVSNAATSSEKPFSSAFDAESLYSADESKSPHGSPGRLTTKESPSQEYSQNHFRKSSGDDAENHSRSFDEPSWGNFDNNDDDIDSVWGFNTKDPNSGKHDEKYFFGSNDFGASPDRNSSPHSDGGFQKNNLFSFEDSVAGSPRSRAGNSPRYSVESRDPFFDSFSRYDSFSTHDRVSSPRQENFSRFDSMSSTQGFDHRSNYSFDDNDPFGSSGPFKVSSETSPREKF